MQKKFSAGQLAWDRDWLLGQGVRASVYLYRHFPTSSKHPEQPVFQVA
jgi:hypothetical protein